MAATAMYYSGLVRRWIGVVSVLLPGFQAAVGFDEGREESSSDDGGLDGLGDSDIQVTPIARSDYESEVGIGIIHVF